MLSVGAAELDPPLIGLLADETARQGPGQDAVLDRLFDLVFAAVLLPAAAGWLLAHRLSRAKCTLVVAIAGGLVGQVAMGPEVALALAACSAAVAYVAAGPGFLPTTLDETARIVRESPRRWWR